MMNGICLSSDYIVKKYNFCSFASILYSLNILAWSKTHDSLLMAQAMWKLTNLYKSNDSKLSVFVLTVDKEVILIIHFYNADNLF